MNRAEYKLCIPLLREILRHVKTDRAIYLFTGQRMGGKVSREEREEGEASQTMFWGIIGV
jgi:hypothetical protein